MTLGRVIPLLIALGFITDLGARFIPSEDFTFRAWEGISRYPRSFGPCTPNARYESHRAHGDLVNSRLDLAVPHTDIFTTDAYGCRRNGDAPMDQPLGTFLIGDSFAIGLGVSDDETLAAQLQKIWKRPVYNAGKTILSMWRLNALFDRLQKTRGLVLYECLERNELMSSEQVLDAHYSVWEHRHRSLQKCWDGFYEVSPARILCQRVFRRMENDRYLPDTKKGWVLTRQLKNGATMLFHPVDMGNYGQARPMNIGGVPALQDQLKRRGLQLLVVLVPDKYDVYASLLQDPPPAPVSPYLDQLEGALKAAGVPVVNLRRVLTHQAAQELNQGAYLYLQDDTHWNRRGIEVAAREIAKQVRHE